MAKRRHPPAAGLVTLEGLGFRALARRFFLLVLIPILLPAVAAAGQVPAWQQNSSNQIQAATPENVRPVTYWAPIGATLNQQMSTRSGPGTKYTEELGTLPRDTRITVYRQEMSSVPWGLVEFEYQGGLYRAYTGMKRIDAAQSVPVYKEAPTPALVAQEVVPRYGPGLEYAPFSYRLLYSMRVNVCGEERGYAMIEYGAPEDPSKWVRSWVPVSALSGYVSIDR